MSEAEGKSRMSSGSRLRLRLLALLASVFFVLPVQAQDTTDPVEVEIAAYEFPPYYSSRLPRHLLGELVAELNQRQQRFQFTITEVRPAKRYEALQPEGCCSLIFFESLDWGWSEHTEDIVDAGVLLSQGSDCYVRLKGAPEEPVERIGGVVGYHYDFAGYQNDTKLLEEEYNLYLADTHRTLINMLLGERLDMIVLSEEYIQLLQQEEPELAAQLEVLDEVDQQYRTQVLAARDGPVPAEWIKAELQSMYEDGVLTALFSSFGVQNILITDES